MKKLLLLIIMVNIGIQASACRFTIREIGYSNILLEQYQLILEADSLKHKKQITDFKNIAFAYSIDANVDYQFIQTDSSTPKVRLLNGEGNEIYNSTVENRKDIIHSVTTCLSSPLRQKLTEYIGKSFAVIVYFEGKNPGHKNIEKQISDARKKFRTVSPHLDKAVSEGIEVLKIPLSDRQKETIVLAALSIPTSSTKPIISIIYGRGRLAGGVLQENKITSQDIFNNLVLLGTDCECGIDLSPLLENTLPLNWSAEIRQEIAEMLVFDADNPIILAEMSRILAKGASSSQGDLNQFIPNTFDLKTKVENSAQEDTSSKALPVTTLALLILAAVVIASGLLIYFRKR